MTLLYFAPVPWESYQQRPHYLARHFLRRAGHRVVWIDPYPTRMPRVSDVRGVFRRPRLRTPRPPGLTVVRPGGLPLEPLAIGRRLNRTVLWHRLHRRLPTFRDGTRLIVGVGRPHSLALAAVERLDPTWSFYDAMDDFPEFYRGRAQRAAGESEQAIVSTVNAILTSSAGLWNKFASRGAKRIMVRNGFDMASLPRVGARPAGPPVIGYVGSVASWFDWPLVIRLARTVPDASVQIVGPLFTPPPRPLPPNITLFQACPHEQAVEHISQFSVGLIPFKLNRLTAGVDPIKYYGYRAMGLPVLTTAFGDMAGRGPADGVFILNDDDGLETTTGVALAARVDAATIARFREEHSWDRRFSDAKLFEL